MQLLVIRDALDAGLEKKIREFYESQSFRTVFQSVDYFLFFQEVRFYKPLLFVAIESDRVTGLLLAVLIREGDGLLSLMSQRCVVYGGPMAYRDDPDIINALLAKLNNTVKHSALFTQFRNFRKWPERVHHIFKANGFVLRDRLNSFVLLQEKFPVELQFSSSRRRQLKKALQSGAIVREANSQKEVDQLYTLLEDLYHQKVKKPLPEPQFFRLFFEQIVPKGAGVILLVWYEDKLIGGIVSPFTEGVSISELYVCGLDREYPACYPSVLATWAAMDYGQRHGIQYFDFMGLGRPEVPYGVRDFKLRFGGNQMNLGRYARRNQKVLYVLAELGYNVWRTIRSKI